jgi:transposase
MVLHRNAKLGLAGRFALLRAVEDGCSLKEAAAAFSISPVTGRRWSRRWQTASEQERRSLVCLFDRSSRPSQADAAPVAGARAGTDLRNAAREG